MRSAVTAYTKRCSSVIRRDQAPARTYFKGSGFPIPWNGFRITASTRSKTRSATRRFVATQNRRSWRSSGWKIASRSTFLAKAELLPQVVDCLRLQPLRAHPPQRCDQPLRILRRPQEVCGFQETFEFIGCDERDISSTASMDDHGLPSFGDGITERGEVFAGVSVGGLFCHGPTPYRFSVHLRDVRVKPPNQRMERTRGETVCFVRAAVAAGRSCAGRRSTESLGSTQNRERVTLQLCV